MVALLGILCGVLASLPLALALRREPSGIGPGIVAVIGSFLFIQSAIIVVRLAWQDQTLPFGSLAAVTFLISAVVIVLRRS